MVGLCCLAFALGVSGLDRQSLWRDEVDAIRLATRPWPEILQSFAAPGQNGPLYFLLLRPWLAVAGTSEFALRFFSLFWGVLLIPLLYRFMVGWGGRSFALLVALAAVARRLGQPGDRPKR